MGNGLEGYYVQNEPVAVIGQHTFTSVSVGNHSCGLTALRKIYCWGLGENGQLGNGSDGQDYQETEPVQVSGQRNYQSLSVGLNHTCAITMQDELYCWGSGAAGKLGNGSVDNQTLPVRVSGHHLFASVSAGANYTCAITKQDELYCWGAGGDRLGVGSDVGDQLTPVPVSPPDDLGILLIPYFSVDLTD